MRSFRFVAAGTCSAVLILAGAGPSEAAAEKKVVKDPGVDVGPTRNNITRMVAFNGERRVRVVLRYRGPNYGRYEVATINWSSDQQTVIIKRVRGEGVTTRYFIRYRDVPGPRAL